MINAERLIELLMERRLSQAELARRVGISSSAINNIIVRGSGSSHISKIARELATSPEYLLGETDDPSPSAVADRQSPSRAEGASPANLVEVDQIDLRYGLGASYSDGHVEIGKRAFDREWLRTITSTPPARLAWAAGEGDSMEPTIRSGEVVLIDTSADKRHFDDTIWAVAIGEVGMIKRLRSRGETVELLSDNPLVPPQTAADGELHPVGRVIAVVRRL